MTLRLLTITLMLVLSHDAARPAEAGSRAVADLAPGVFLYAVPELSDMHFYHTVVLLVTYSPEGAMGLVINRPTQYHAAEVIPELEADPEGPPVLYYGGPVGREQVFIVFRSNNRPNGTVEIFENVFFTNSRNVLDEKIKDQNMARDLRIYAGYAGWAPGQLDHEIKRGDWVIGRPVAESVFAENPEDVWDEIHNLKDKIEVRHRPRGPVPAAGPPTPLRLLPRKLPVEFANPPRAVVY